MKKKISTIINYPVPQTVTSVVTKISEFMTALASDPTYFFVAPGKISQRIIAHGLLQGFIEEYEDICKKGRIDEKFDSSEESKYLLAELLDYLDSNLPDKDIFKIIKQIFYKVALKDTSTYDIIKIREYMTTAKNLTPQEIVLLQSCYELANNPGKYRGKVPDRNIIEVEKWFEITYEFIPWKYELLNKYELQLISKYLFSERIGREKNQVLIYPNYHISDFGIEFCEFIWK